MFLWPVGYGPGVMSVIHGDHTASQRAGNHPAQGCEERATLGQYPNIPQP
jgi:hypothetical protein